ncbi:hypothetical protein [Sphingomonas solaris]|uniref:TonB-dependent receptor n=1 Tax=Alterirhizorhabdus solaris TaxID=2529389 RepID=A0A558R8L9_9SPHN|nr:hypothetical protein [Sphingomonas solaris]TVV75740.1 hypothetical protein FOY91_06160 [Sphingomonas solaris]
MAVRGGAGIFAKNIFDRRILLSQNTVLPTTADFGAPGYSTFGQTLQRQIGASLRYNFGSR